MDMLKRKGFLPSIDLITGGIIVVFLLTLQANAALSDNLQQAAQGDSDVELIPNQTDATDSPGDLSEGFSVESQSGGSFEVKPAIDRPFSDSFSEGIGQSETLAGIVAIPAANPSLISGNVNSETFANMNRLVGSDTHQLDGLTPGNSVVTFGKDHPGLLKSNAIKNGASGSAGIDELTFGVPVTAAPEPAEWAMLLTGAAVLGFVARRRALLA